MAAETTELALRPAWDLWRSVWRLNHALERVSSAVEARLGVTSQQRLVIRCIGQFPGVTPKQLAKLLHVDAATISVTLARLERRGYISRRRDDRDRRRVMLGLRKAGRSIDAAPVGGLERAGARLLADDRADLKRAQRVLDALTAALEAEVSELNDEIAARRRVP